MCVTVLLRISNLSVCRYNVPKHSLYLKENPHISYYKRKHLVAFTEIFSVNFEKVWNATCGQTAVSCKGDFRLAPPYIIRFPSSEILYGVGRKLAFDVSGLCNGPFYRGEGLVGAWKGFEILSGKVGNHSLQFDAWRSERGRLLISEQVVHKVDFNYSCTK